MNGKVIFRKFDPKTFELIDNHLVVSLRKQPTFREVAT